MYSNTDLTCIAVNEFFLFLNFAIMSVLHESQINCKKKKANLKGKKFNIKLNLKFNLKKFNIKFFFAGQSVRVLTSALDL